MASGLPIPGTNLEGLRKVFDRDENGLVVEPDDVPSLTQALHRLIGDSDLRRGIGESFRQYAKSKYSFERCIEETERLFSVVKGDHDLPGSPDARQNLEK